MEYLQCIDDFYNNINDYNQNTNRKILFVFDEMIADIITNKKFQAIIKELFIRCRKLSISLGLSFAHYLIMKIHNKRKPQQIAINHSADIDYKDFVMIYRKCTSEPYYFLTIDTTTLPHNNFLRFRNNLLDSLWRFMMTITDELKILDDKIKVNQAQYDLDKEAAEISAL